MKLVFVTRKVDRGDALTGFVFGWIEAIANELANNPPQPPLNLRGEDNRLYVICQEKGDISGLPANVEVHSFGKERGYSRIRQGYELLILSFKLARRAGGFFVHMHPIYAIAAWLPAKLFGKKIILWYTHNSVDLKLRIAHALVDEVLTASKESFRLPLRKVRVLGHGIDLEKFHPSLNPSPSRGGKKERKFQILSIGRISPVKDYETLIKAVQILVKEMGVSDLEVQIYGRIGLPEHQAYLDSLIKFVRAATLEDYVKFQGELNYEYVDEVYREADLFVNLSMTGSIDKNVLEAAACGTIVLSSNEAFEEPLKKISADLFFKRNNPEDLAEKIVKLKNRRTEERMNLTNKLRAWVQKEHNLDNLIGRIIDRFK